MSISNDIQLLFQPHYTKDYKDLVARLSFQYLDFCLLHFQALSNGKNEPKIINLIQNVILLISYLKSCLGETWMQNELPVVTELGLRLCEHVGSLKDFKRSRIYILMGLVVKFVKTVTTLDEETNLKIKVPNKHGSVWLMDSIY